LLWLGLKEFHEMTISKAAIGFVAGACLAAGAGGAYVVTRPVQPSALTAEQSAASAGSAAPVEQSEAIVTDPLVPVEAAEAAEDAPEAKPVAEGRIDPPRRPAAVSTERRRTEEVSRPSAPTTAPSPAEAPNSSAPSAPVQSVEPPRIVDNQASRAVEPVGPLYDELVIAADSVIGLEIESAINSDRARVEDAVVARVTRDVKVGNRVVIPAGSKANGEVTTVERGGRLKDRARLGVRFTSIVLADGTRVPIETETIYREGDSPTNESAAKIGGGAIGGAIIGGILGGGKGAAIGSIVGAGAGTGAVVAGGRNAATLPAGTPVTVRVHDPVVVTVER
jgi:type IV secretory pathway VirB10-like protein